MYILKLQLLTAGTVLGAGKNKWEERPECIGLQISARKYFLNDHSKEGNGISESPEVTVTTTWPAARKQGLGTSRKQKCV